MSKRRDLETDSESIEQVKKKSRTGEERVRQEFDRIPEDLFGRLMRIAVKRFGSNASLQARKIWSICRTLVKIAERGSTEENKQFDITAEDVLKQFLTQNGADGLLEFDFDYHPLHGDTHFMKLRYNDSQRKFKSGSFTIVCRHPISINVDQQDKLRKILSEIFDLKSEEAITEKIVILRAFIGRRRKDMKHTTKTRNEKGRNHKQCEIDEKTGLEQYIIQRGRCVYLKNQILRFEDQLADPENKMSSERLNQDIGYVKGNFVWCCVKLNSRVQFTTELHQKFVESANGQLSMPESVQNSIQAAATQPERKSDLETTRKIMIDGKFLCLECRVYLPIDAFTVRKGCKVPVSKCKACINAGDRGRRKDTIRGFFWGLIQGCSTHTKLRKKVFANKEKKLGEKITVHEKAFANELSIEWVVKQCIAQKGLCSYSRHPLHPYPGQFNTISIERIDESLGYFPENCVLICLFFQTGQAQWSRDIFMRTFGSNSTSTNSTSSSTTSTSIQ